MKRGQPASVDVAALDSPEKAPDESSYDQLIVEIAALECVSAALSEWDLSGRPTDSTCRIGSAELLLRKSIKALHELGGDIEERELAIKTLRQAVQS